MSKVAVKANCPKCNRHHPIEIFAEMVELASTYPGTDNVTLEWLCKECSCAFGTAGKIIERYTTEDFYEHNKIPRI